MLELKRAACRRIGADWSWPICRLPVACAAERRFGVERGRPRARNCAPSGEKPWFSRIRCGQRCLSASEAGLGHFRENQGLVLIGWPASHVSARGIIDGGPTFIRILVQKTESGTEVYQAPGPIALHTAPICRNGPHVIARRTIAVVSRPRRPAVWAAVRDGADQVRRTRAFAAD